MPPAPAPKLPPRPGTPDLAHLRKAAIKRKPGGRAPTHSVLVRQKGLGGKPRLLAGKKSGGMNGLDKGSGPKQLAPVKNPAVPAHKPAIKKAAGLEEGLAAQKKAALKAMAPAKSSLIRQKGHVDKGVLSEAKKLGMAKNAAKAGVGKELAHVKKAAAPARKGALKEVAGLKQGLAAKRKAVLKAIAPAKSSLIRQKKLAGHQLEAGKAGLGKELGKAKSGFGTELGQAKKAAHPGKPALTPKKLGAKIRQPKVGAKAAPKLGRLRRVSK